MDRATIRTGILARLGRPATDQLIDSTTLNSFINDSLHWYVARYPWPWAVTTANIATTNGNDAYAVPASYLATIELRIAGLPPLLRMDIGQLNASFPHATANGGTPVAFAVRGQFVVVRPTPITGALPTVVHTYQTDETDLAADGTSPSLMPTAYHAALCEIGAMFAARRAGDMAKADAAYKAYLFWEESMLGRMERDQAQIKSGLALAFPVVGTVAS